MAFALEKYLDDKKGHVNKALRGILPHLENSPLIEAMRYSLLAESKRLRPILCIASYEMFKSKMEEVLPVASALELIHTFTLIHDDLPCMDNDDYRRGKLSSHKVFGEGMAVLAGDALFNLAYGVLVDAPLPTEIKVKVIQKISSSLGVEGVIGGQVEDINIQKGKVNAAHLEKIYQGKTAALIEAAVESGGIVGGAAEEDLRLLSDYGRNLGLAFQIMDDVLEAKGGEKPDEENYVTLLGIEKAEDKACKYMKQAQVALKKFGKRAEVLKELANYVVERKV